MNKTNAPLPDFEQSLPPIGTTITIAGAVPDLRFGRAAIVRIGYPIIIRVGSRATSELGMTENSGALVETIDDAITIFVAIGAALVLLRPDMEWALVQTVDELVPIAVDGRTPLGRQAGMLRTKVGIIANTIAITIWRRGLLFSNRAYLPRRSSEELTGEPDQEGQEEDRW